MKKLILIDGNALVHRAFHALPPTMSSPKGVLTNAVFGFTSVLIRMIKDLKPDYIVATFDLAGPTVRHEEFAEYKSHRVKAPDELYAQIPLIKEVVKAVGIPIYEKQGYEADDLIGSLAERSKKEKDLQTVIVTGDLDTLQLVDKDKVVVFTLRKGITDTVTYNEKGVVSRYGLKPNQMNDFKGLKGDPSDNIPGVPGVGEKTASALIQKFKNLEFLYKKISNYQFPITNQIPNSKSKKLKTKLEFPLTERLIAKLLEHQDQALFSKKLATIYRDLDIDFSVKKSNWRENLDKDALLHILQKYNLSSLIRRLGELDIKEEENTLFNQDNGSRTSGDSVNKLGSKMEIDKGLNEIEKLKEMTFDIQDGNFSYTLDGKNVYSFDLGDLMESKGGALLWKKFVKISEDEKISKTGHGLKELARLYLEKDIHLKGLDFDTKIAAWLLNSDARNYDIDKVYFAEFQEGINPKSLRKPNYIWELRKRLQKKLNEEGLTKILKDIELPLVKVLAEMELSGVKIDIRSLNKLSDQVNGELSKLEKDIYKHAGINFNINSPKQMKEVLFDKLNIKGKVRKTTKGVLSTAAPELEKLLEKHPIIALILKYRELQKLKTTYIEPFPHLIDKKTGRLHTTFNQTGTATGRLSSQDPNLQNIPVRTEIGQEFRKSFIARPGFKLLSFDYSQLELRIAAHISKDSKMIKAFKNGEDIHSRTAAEIFNVDTKSVDTSMRREAKVINFGVLYGMGLNAFQRASGMSRESARDFIDRYMEEFVGIADYVRSTKLDAHKKGYVSTIFGRKRNLLDINSKMPQLVSQSERIAINMPIQGTASDLIKMAMGEVYELIHDEYKEGDVKLLLQVHDELLFEVKNNLVKEVNEKVKRIMEGVYKLDVPLTVDVKYGDNWRDMELL